MKENNKIIGLLHDAVRDLRNDLNAFKLRDFTSDDACKRVRNVRSRYDTVESLVEQLYNTVRTQRPDNYQGRGIESTSSEMGQANAMKAMESIMTIPTIHTEEVNEGWFARFDDYDGAPDAGDNGVMGLGPTREAAIKDLLKTAAVDTGLIKTKGENKCQQY